MASGDPLSTVRCPPRAPAPRRCRGVATERSDSAGEPARSAHSPAQQPSGAEAPPAGAFPGGSTQVADARPIGTAELHSDMPPVHFVDARDPEAPPSLVWWGVVLVGSILRWA